jgi:hypothetical protein
MALRKKSARKKAVKIRLPVPPATKAIPNRRKEARRTACRKPIEDES